MKGLDGRLGGRTEVKVERVGLQIKKKVRDTD